MTHTPPHGPAAPPVPLRPDPRPELLAAHSMDSDWFIVDVNGDVLLMDTLEAGGMPQGLAPQSDPSIELADLLRPDLADEGYGHYEAVHDLPFVYVRQGKLPPKRWDELPEALREAAGHLRVPVSLRDAEVIDLGQFLDPKGLQYWSELSEILNEIDHEGLSPDLKPTVERYAQPLSDDDPQDVDWVFPPPPTPGTIIPPVEREQPPEQPPRPASAASPAKPTPTEAPPPASLLQTIRRWFGG